KLTLRVFVVKKLIQKNLITTLTLIMIICLGIR
ncbi:hypothetical protein D047_5039B, partial [Vibrio parahaemolyticus VPTS-2010_2]